MPIVKHKTVLFTLGSDVRYAHTWRPLDSVAPDARPDGVNAETTGDHGLGDAGWPAVEAVRSLTMPASAPGLTVSPFCLVPTLRGDPLWGEVPLECVGPKALLQNAEGTASGCDRGQGSATVPGDSIHCRSEIPPSKDGGGTCDFNSDTGAMMCSRSGGRSGD